VNPKNKCLKIIILLCSTIFISWGNVGHRIINGNSTLSFPEAIDFLLYWKDGLIAHGSDADYRKSSDPSEENKHYIDIDNFPEFIATGRITQDFDSVVAKHGYNFAMQQGILPWAILETIDSLTAAFEYYRWDRAMLLAADLGHYVGDAHVPLHITRNYNGQYSNQIGVHSRYESIMIERYDHEIFYNGNSMAYIQDISDYVFNMIYDNYIYVDSVLIGDRIATTYSGNTESYEYYFKLWELSESFTIDLFKSASSKLASLIYTCWLNAGSPNPTTDIAALNEPIQDFVLCQNYPNPFNSQTNIAFELEKTAEISISIFNLKGQMVDEIFNEIREPGYHTINWDAGNVSAGIYIIKMEAESFIAMKKCLLLK
jgi:hypothetical protein